MTAKADLYLSIRNPNSYLVVGQYRAMASDYDLDIAVKIVYPLAIRHPQYFEQTSPLWVPYLIKDCYRYADFYGMTFALPSPDPIVQDLATLEISPDQPHIYRLTRLVAFAARCGRGLAFAHELLHLIWSGDVVGWDQGDYLAVAAEKAGLELREMDAAIAADAASYDAEIFGFQDDLHAAGHWYTPSLVVNNELFFGDSRVEQALWHMKQNGLMRR